MTGVLRGCSVRTVSIRSLQFLPLESTSTFTVFWRLTYPCWEETTEISHYTHWLDGVHLWCPSGTKFCNEHDTRLLPGDIQFHKCAGHLDHTVKAFATGNCFAKYANVAFSFVPWYSLVIHTAEWEYPCPRISNGLSNQVLMSTSGLFWYIYFSTSCDPTTVTSTTFVPSPPVLEQTVLAFCSWTCSVESTCSDPLSWVGEQVLLRTSEHHFGFGCNFPSSNRSLPLISLDTDVGNLYSECMWPTVVLADHRTLKALWILCPRNLRNLQE